MVIFATIAFAGLTGCATTQEPERLTLVNGRDSLERLQSQIYEAATGPHHLGSVYKR
jgi:hypothetical protein